MRRITPNMLFKSNEIFLNRKLYKNFLPRKIDDVKKKDKENKTDLKCSVANVGKCLIEKKGNRMTLFNKSKNGTKVELQKIALDSERGQLLERAIKFENKDNRFKINEEVCDLLRKNKIRNYY